MVTKLLVADDEDQFANLILTVFQKQVKSKEFEFVFAPDGQTALDKLRANPTIDILLVDICMPRIDGLTLLSKLQEPEFRSNPGLTSIVISAFDDIANIRKAMNAKAFDFLTKPINLDDLEITVNKAVAHSQRLKKAAEQYNLAQDTLRQSNEDLERRVKERTAELDTFAHMAAHDLKAPLGNVVGYVEFIEAYYSDLEPEEMLLALQQIKSSGRRGIKIVDELLLLASIGKSNVEVRALDMQKIVEQVRYDLDLVIKTYEADIITPDTWPVALGYAPWIEMVWTNYISNALKYGGRPPHLELGYTDQTDSGSIRFWIKDNGPGLRQEAQTDLFNEFTRLDGSNVQGHGLGLATVRRIIEKLNGQVGVESRIGQGSTFYFDLPRYTEPHTNALSNAHSQKEYS